MKRREKPFFTMGGMYILGAALCILTLALIMVEINVRYRIREESLLLPERETLAAQKQERLEREAQQTPATLLVTEEGDPTSGNARESLEYLLGQMREPYTVCDAKDFTPQALDSCQRLVLAVSHYQLMGQTLETLEGWVNAGGSLMIAYPPDLNGSFVQLQDLLGIQSCGKTIMVEGLHFVRELMIGGTAHDFPIDEPFDCSMGLTLTDDCEVYLTSTRQDYPVPLIWRRRAGQGSVVVDNFNIMGKTYLGIHAAAYSLLGDYCVYPVINAASFFIDDFPSPIPEGDSAYIERDYHLSIADFYSQVWWNDVQELSKRWHIPYTGLVIENYSNQIEGDFDRNDDISRYLYFGNMLLRDGGEIGIHGYNHMPLVLENFDYKDDYNEYIQWPSLGDIRSSLDEVFAFTQALFPRERLQVYVPLSNILSQEAREILGSYMQLAALSELNLHLVSTHFQHPDDVLDEDRGAALGWAELFSRYQAYVEWLYTSAPEIRSLTGSELAAAVASYDLLTLERQQEAGEIRITLDNFQDEAWLLLRLNEGQEITSVEGGSAVPVAEQLYLLSCEHSEILVHCEGRQDP